jgi:hypothetical protein
LRFNFILLRIFAASKLYAQPVSPPVMERHMLYRIDVRQCATDPGQDGVRIIGFINAKTDSGSGRVTAIAIWFDLG